MTRRWEWTLIAAALVASGIVLGLVTHDFAVEVSYLGMATLGVIAMLLLRDRLSPPPPLPAALPQPDWSVTVMAIDVPDRAIAIVDRAGRLVCANPEYEANFGIAHVPPRLALADGHAALLAAAADRAWHHGRARVALPDIAPGEPEWHCAIARAGRGEDFLVWQFSAGRVAEPVAEIAASLGGTIGRAMSRAGIAAALVDGDGTIVAGNSSFAERAIGAAPADAVGRELVPLLRHEEGERLSWARDGEQGAPLTFHHAALCDPGTEAGTAAAAHSLVLLAEAGGGEVRAAAEQLETLLGQLPLGLAMTDRDGRLLFANPAFLRAAGREGQVPPTYPTDLVVLEDKGALADAIRRYGRGHAAAGDIAVRLTARADEPASIGLASVRGLGDAAVLLALADSTEEMRLKRQVAQAIKMQAVGQLAGGVAHDFNNVLTAIIGTCDLMLMRHIPGDSDYDDIQQIRANSNRAASLTRQLLAFSRQQTLRPEVLQLPDIVAETSQMLKRLIGEKVELVVSHDRDLAPVRADRGQLGQVVMNLVVNARDAIHARGDGRGRLTLSTRRASSGQVRAMRSEIIPSGDYTALVVEDDGNGIPPENLAKIFEPFFTTKEQGKGTGLGLSTVYGFVKQSGGFIFADSEPGKGARFSVYLPVYQGSAPVVRPIDTPTPGVWSRGGRILLVEDEDAVRMVADRTLTRSGYVVTTASDGEEGLGLVRSGGNFDLIVSDVVMPTMDGPAMVREIRAFAPALPVLFMSGYAEEQLRKEIDLPNVHFLAKPFSVQQISGKVGEILAKRVRSVA